MPHQAPLSNGESVTIPIRGATTQQVQDGRLSLRTVIIGIIAAALALLAVLVALQVFFAEKIPELTEDAFQAARQRWEQRGPASYDIELEIGGAQPGTVHVEVRDGVVTAANRDGRPTPEWTWDEWSVPGLFEMLEREFEFAADPQREMQAPPGSQLWLRCEFDPEFGFPRHFHRYVTGGAPEVFWRTTSFNPM